MRVRAARVLEKGVGLAGMLGGDAGRGETTGEHELLHEGEEDGDDDGGFDGLAWARSAGLVRLVRFGRLRSRSSYACCGAGRRGAVRMAWLRATKGVRDKGDGGMDDGWVTKHVRNRGWG